MIWKNTNILKAYEADQLKPIANIGVEIQKHREYVATTMNKKKIIQILQEQHSYLHSEFGVEKIGLFGSYSRDSAHEDSDIDLMIEFARPIGFRFTELAEHLEELLGAPVDILTLAGIEGIRVPQVAAEIQESVAYV